MNTIVKTTLINCTLDELYEFHMDSNNIKKITPENIKVELLNDDSDSFEGKIVTLKITKFFIPQIWKVKIEKLTKPTLLVDVALKSPFSYWKHQHIFTQKEKGCELKDEIQYRLPLGALGQLMNPFIKKDIESMFDYRHERTKALLENK